VKEIKHNISSFFFAFCTLRFILFNTYLSEINLWRFICYFLLFWKKTMEDVYFDVPILMLTTIDRSFFAKNSTTILMTSGGYHSHFHECLINHVIVTIFRYAVLDLVCHCNYIEFNLPILNYVFGFCLLVLLWSNLY